MRGVAGVVARDARHPHTPLAYPDRLRKLGPSNTGGGGSRKRTTSQALSIEQAWDGFGWEGDDNQPAAPQSQALSIEQAWDRLRRG